MSERFSKDVLIRLSILAFTMFMVMVGFSILFPILPLFITQELHGTARDLGFIFSLYSIVHFFCAPFWGIWSDKHGRKPAIMIGIAGIMLTFILIALSQNIWHLYIARVIGGFLTSAALPAVFAYAADLTNSKQRGPAIGMIGGSMGLGIVFGPALGGFLSGYTMVFPLGNIFVSHLRFPFLVAAVLGLLNLFLALAFLKEDKSKISESPARLGPLERVAAAFGSHLRHYFIFALLVSVSFACLTSTYTLFAFEEFGLDARHVGYVFALFGFAGAFVQGVVTGKMINRFGEPFVIKLGVPLLALSYLLLTFSPNPFWFGVFSAFVGASQGLLFPSLTAAISKGTTVGQGGALGLYDSMEAMGRILGPIAGGVLFELAPARGSHHWPYYFAAGLLFISIIIGHTGIKEAEHKEWLEELAETVERGGGDRA
ncbi:MAG: MFS transporter [bacterium]